jgi:hypothetical protein
MTEDFPPMFKTALPYEKNGGFHRFLKMAPSSAITVRFIQKRLWEGQRLSHQELERSQPPRFFDVVYPNDSRVSQDKTKVTVRFETTERNAIASVFGIRMIRSDSHS